MDRLTAAMSTGHVHRLILPTLQWLAVRPATEAQSINNGLGQVAQQQIQDLATIHHLPAIHLHTQETPSIRRAFIRLNHP
jgi:hypothetical protein